MADNLSVVCVRCDYLNGSEECKKSLEVWDCSKYLFVFDNVVLKKKKEKDLFDFTEERKGSRSRKDKI